MGLWIGGREGQGISEKSNVLVCASVCLCGGGGGAVVR